LPARRLLRGKCSRLLFELFGIGLNDKSPLFLRVSPMNQRNFTTTASSLAGNSRSSDHDMRNFPMVKAG
jgi:hypothetical protein